MKWSFFGVEPQIGELSGQPLENFPQRPTMPQILRFDKYVLCVASSHPFLPRKGCDVTRINFGIFRHDLHGSLAKEFSELRALEKLDLRDNNITGDLHVLKQNTLLRDLDLDNTRISGDLQSLAKATKLERLYLRGTQVYGDVVALSNAKDLRRLHLTETKVHGDVVALKNAKGLWILDLAETRVHGDLASLANLTKLENLQLSNTKVSGDLSAMLHWEKSNAWAFRAPKSAVIQRKTSKIAAKISGLWSWHGRMFALWMASLRTSSHTMKAPMSGFVPFRP